jgi:DNA-binding Lrp family transcriptional regulator
MEEIKTDELDRAILSELIENSRLSANELAKKIGAHPNTVLLRIRKLERSGAIARYTAVPNYDRLGYGFQALVFVKLKSSSDWEKSIRPISDLPEVVSFFVMTGEHDALAIVRFGHKGELESLLKKIQGNAEVVQTTTALVISSFKRPHEFNPMKIEPQKG